MIHRLLLALLFVLPTLVTAQTCGFSEGKNLAALRSAVFAKESPRLSLPVWFKTSIIAAPEQPATQHFLILLPKWSAEALPFFCKIEHDWGKKSRLPLKFRLGSVEYVDWLEGK